MHRANISLLVLSDPLSASQTSLDETPLSSATRPADGPGGMASATAAASSSHEPLSNGLAHQAAQPCSRSGLPQPNAATATTQDAVHSNGPAMAETNLEVETSSTAGPAMTQHQESCSNAPASSADLAEIAAIQSSIGSKQSLPKPGSTVQQFQAMPQTPEERLALLRYGTGMPLLCMDARQLPGSRCPLLAVKCINEVFLDSVHSE